MSRILWCAFLIAVYPASVFAVFYGAPVSPGSHLVSLEIQGLGYCSGQFVASDQLVTAAHCVSDAGKAVPLERLRIKGIDGVIFRAVHIRVHPHFSRSHGVSHHDVAVITVAEEFEGQAPSLPRAAQPRFGRALLMGCGRVDYRSKKRRCQQGQVLYARLLGHVVSVGWPKVLKKYGVGVAPNDSGGPIFSQSESQLFGVHWGTLYWPGSAIPLPVIGFSTDVSSGENRMFLDEAMSRSKD